LRQNAFSERFEMDFRPWQALPLRPVHQGWAHETLKKTSLFAFAPRRSACHMAPQMPDGRKPGLFHIFFHSCGKLPDLSLHQPPEHGSGPAEPVGETTGLGTRL
jgi:hypothetical protein